MDQLGPPLRLEGERVEQAVDMRGGLGAALRREAGGLVEHQRGIVLVDHHFARERHFILGEGGALARRPRVGTHRLGRGHAQHLTGGDAIARADPRAVEPQLPGARPFGDDREAGVGQMPLEPAIDADAVVIGGDGELADGLAHASARIVMRPANSATTAPVTDNSA